MIEHDPITPTGSNANARAPRYFTFPSQSEASSSTTTAYDEDYDEEIVAANKKLISQRRHGNSSRKSDRDDSDVYDYSCRRDSDDLSSLSSSDYYSTSRSSATAAASKRTAPQKVEDREPLVEEERSSLCQSSPPLTNREKYEGNAPFHPLSYQSSNSLPRRAASIGPIRYKPMQSLEQQQKHFNKDGKNRQHSYQSNILKFFDDSATGSYSTNREKLRNKGEAADAGKSLITPTEKGSQTPTHFHINDDDNSIVHKSSFSSARTSLHPLSLLSSLSSISEALSPWSSEKTPVNDQMSNCQKDEEIDERPCLSDDGTGNTLPVQAEVDQGKPDDVDDTTNVKSIIVVPGTDVIVLSEDDVDLAVENERYYPQCPPVQTKNVLLPAFSASTAGTSEEDDLSNEKEELFNLRLDENADSIQNGSILDPMMVDPIISICDSINSPRVIVRGHSLSVSESGNYTNIHDAEFPRSSETDCIDEEEARSDSSWVMKDAVDSMTVSAHDPTHSCTGDAEAPSNRFEQHNEDDLIVVEGQDESVNHALLGESSEGVPIVDGEDRCLPINQRISIVETMGLQVESPDSIPTNAIIVLDQFDQNEAVVMNFQTSILPIAEALSVSMDSDLRNRFRENYQGWNKEDAYIENDGNFSVRSYNGNSNVEHYTNFRDDQVTASKEHSGTRSNRHCDRTPHSVSTKHSVEGRSLSSNISLASAPARLPSNRSKHSKASHASLAKSNESNQTHMADMAVSASSTRSSSSLQRKASCISKEHRNVHGRQDRKDHMSVRSLNSRLSLKIVNMDPCDNNESGRQLITSPSIELFKLKEAVAEYTIQPSPFILGTQSFDVLNTPHDDVHLAIARSEQQSDVEIHSCIDIKNEYQATIDVSNVLSETIDVSNVLASNLISDEFKSSIKESCLVPKEGETALSNRSSQQNGTNLHPDQLSVNPIQTSQSIESDSVETSVIQKNLSKFMSDSKIHSPKSIRSDIRSARRLTQDMRSIRSDNVHGNKNPNAPRRSLFPELESDHSLESATLSSEQGQSCHTTSISLQVDTIPRIMQLSSRSGSSHSEASSYSTEGKSISSDEVGITKKFSESKGSLLSSILSPNQTIFPSTSTKVPGSDTMPRNIQHSSSSGRSHFEASACSKEVRSIASNEFGITTMFSGSVGSLLSSILSPNQNKSTQAPGSSSSFEPRSSEALGDMSRSRCSGTKDDPFCIDELDDKYSMVLAQDKESLQNQVPKTIRIFHVDDFDSSICSVSRSSQKSLSHSHNSNDKSHRLGADESRNDTSFSMNEIFKQYCETVIVPGTIKISSLHQDIQRPYDKKPIVKRTQTHRIISAENESISKATHKLVDNAKLQVVDKANATSKDTEDAVQLQTPNNAGHKPQETGRGSVDSRPSYSISKICVSPRFNVENTDAQSSKRKSGESLSIIAQREVCLQSKDESPSIASNTSSSSILPIVDAKIVNEEGNEEKNLVARIAVDAPEIQNVVNHCWSNEELHSVNIPVVEAIHQDKANGGEDNMKREIGMKERRGNRDLVDVIRNFSLVKIVQDSKRPDRLLDPPENVEVKIQPRNSVAGHQASSRLSTIQRKQLEPDERHPTRAAIRNTRSKQVKHSLYNEATQNTLNSHEVSLCERNLASTPRKAEKKPDQELSHDRKTRCQNGYAVDNRLEEKVKRPDPDEVKTIQNIFSENKYQHHSNILEAKQRANITSNEQTVQQSFNSDTTNQAPPFVSKNNIIRHSEERLMGDMPVQNGRCGEPREKRVSKFKNRSSKRSLLTDNLDLSAPQKGAITNQVTETLEQRQPPGKVKVSCSPLKHSSEELQQSDTPSRRYEALQLANMSTALADLSETYTTSSCNMLENAPSKDKVSPNVQTERTLQIGTPSKRDEAIRHGNTSKGFTGLTEILTASDIRRSLDCVPVNNCDPYISNEVSEKVRIPGKMKVSRSQQNEQAPRNSKQSGSDKNMPYSTQESLQRLPGTILNDERICSEHNNELLSVECIDIAGSTDVSALDVIREDEQTLDTIEKLIASERYTPACGGSKATLQAALIGKSQLSKSYVGWKSERSQPQTTEIEQAPLSKMPNNANRSRSASKLTSSKEKHSSKATSSSCSNRKTGDRDSSPRSRMSEYSHKNETNSHQRKTHNASYRKSNSPPKRRVREKEQSHPRETASFGRHSNKEGTEKLRTKNTEKLRTKNQSEFVKGRNRVVSSKSSPPQSRSDVLTGGERRQIHPAKETPRSSYQATKEHSSWCHVTAGPTTLRRDDISRKDSGVGKQRSDSLDSMDLEDFNDFELKKELWRKNKKKLNKVTFDHVITELSLEIMDSQETEDFAMEMIFNSCNNTSFGQKFSSHVFGR